MKRFASLYLLLAVVVAVLISTGKYLSAQQEIPCENPTRLALTNGASWAKGTASNPTVVTVFVEPNHFTSLERSAIQSAFTTWQNANPGAHVVFNVTEGTQPPLGSRHNTYHVHRGTTTTGGATSISNTGSQTTSGNITTEAQTRIDNSITRLSTIEGMMVHEIGHTFGLGDCIGCTQGSTIMSDYRSDCFCPSHPCDQQFHGMVSDGDVLRLQRQGTAMLRRWPYKLAIRHRLQRQRPRQRHVLSLIRVVISVPIAVQVLPAET